MKSREMHRSSSTQRLHFVILLAALLALPALADDGKLRYVSGTGSDKGDCLNKFRPCRTLDYAISLAGKADTIRVAEGSYAIDDAGKLLNLVGAAGRVQGGYSKYSAYSEQTAAAKTMLIGVPPEFRERFERAGFSVIVDRKGIAQDEAQRMRRLTKQVLETEKSHKATPCVSNRSEGFACQSVSLLAHLPLADLMPTSSRGNDVWGFTDLNTGREYAFMGLERGVIILDVTNPEAPEKITTITGSPTTWRDIKIYQHYDVTDKRWRAYAYATADNVTDFLMVLDLSDLPNGIEKINFRSDFTAAHNTYLVNTDYTYGLAQTSSGPQLGIAGGRENGGDHRLYSLSNPRAPSLLTESVWGYAHDLASFPISDARKSSQCTIGQSSAVCQVMSDFNENSIDVWDVTDPSSPQLLSSIGYANAAYVHSGWWTEDGRHLLVHDELDESTFGLNTTVRVFDMADIREPTMVGSWVGPTRAIDHNGFVKGNRYYIANYSEGLTVLDITDPSTPQRIGYFDTYPSSSETSFVGAWGAYPFFASGTIAVGDINTGLYLLRNETLTSSSGSFLILNALQSAVEGDTVTITVARTGGASGAASVDLELLHASTDSQDISFTSQRLTWADGDTANRTTTLTLNADSASEDRELALMRLKAPQGGATVSYPDTAHVHVFDAGSAARLRPLDTSISVQDTRGKALVTITRLGSATGEARLSYRTLPSTFGGFTATEGELIWADGDAASKTISIALDPASLPAGQSATLSVELASPVGANLETPTGANVASVVAEITVRDSSSATPPPSNPPPSSGGGNGGGGGGGGTQLVWLALLGLLIASRWYPKASC